MKLTDKLKFHEVVSPDRASLSGDFNTENCRGIYVYQFSDDMFYVGKSIDVRKRHVQHVHDYKRENPPRLIKRMWWAAVPGDDLELDLAETRVIAACEARDCSLLNILKTGRPRGNDVALVESGERWGIPVPWERKDLPKSTLPFSFTDDEVKLNKFELLVGYPDFWSILDVLQAYTARTIVAPADTAARLWTLTALPSTGSRNRLCCLSVQNAETLVIYEIKRRGKVQVAGFLNVKRRVDGKLPRGIKKYACHYGTLPNCIRLEFSNLTSMRRALDNEVVLDCCYRANAELMRRGVTMYGRFNNPYLTELLVEGNPYFEDVN